VGWSEVLKVIPKLDGNALGDMDRSLTQRFGKIAKKFGKGLLAALTGGGVLGIATSLIDKFLNPLKEVQAAIDRTLSHADDVVTNAKRFGSSPGDLLRLQALGQAKGLGPDQLDVLLTKFTGAVAEAKQDPSKQTSVRLFANDKNLVESFFQFIQGLQKLTPQQQVVVQTEVFGEKQIGKIASFLQADFAKETKLIGGPSNEKLTFAANSLNSKNELKNRLEAQTGLEDFAKKGGVITSDMIRLQDEQTRRDLKFENKDIANYENLAALAKTADELKSIGKDIFNWTTQIFPKIEEGVDALKKMSNSPVLKGIIKYVGGK
jgi:hypothetical protein